MGQLSVVPNLYQAGFFIRFMGNIRCHLRWLLEYDGYLSSEILKGSAVKVFHHTQPTFVTFFLKLSGSFGSMEHNFLHDLDNLAGKFHNGSIKEL
jgi:hypothetical protein